MALEGWLLTVLGTFCVTPEEKVGFGPACKPTTTNLWPQRSETLAQHVLELPEFGPVPGCKMHPLALFKLTLDRC